MLITVTVGFRILNKSIWVTQNKSVRIRANIPQSVEARSVLVMRVNPRPMRYSHLLLSVDQGAQSDMDELARMYAKSKKKCTLV